MEYKPRKSYGAWYGLIVGGAVFGICLWGIGFSLGEEDKVLKLMLLIPAYLFMVIYAGFLMAAFTLRYEANEKGLTIKAGFRRFTIPYDAINELINVQGKVNLFSLIGANWPGFKIGLFTLRGIGPIRMYATRPGEELLYIKSSQGLIGITPADDVYEDLLKTLESRSGKTSTIFDMESIPDDEKGENAREDNFYRLLLRINVLLLLAYGIYLALVFPGSGAPNFIILLLVLALALFFFNIGNAERLYQFSSTGGYALLSVGILVTGIFFILTLGELSL
ncbi:hypothetical protein ASZ90_018167 [hydrocarbon metagenome]|uniref:Bacterial Pleckstrin homology domain-containing protein n=1 Tax=hydrocarbon metagenome TaxID=938273 RepID=A0A0W8E6Z5_9ZZZZ